MTCYRPLSAFQCADGSIVFVERRRHDIVRRLDLPCGQCIGCRLRRSRDWSVRIMHEASMYAENCFVTLTYSPEFVPADGSLRYRDYQLFMKRLRKYADSPVRFFMCGEYGSLNLRPHYHSCLFGINFSDSVPAGKSAAGEFFFRSATLDKLWPLGRAVVQALNSSTAAYCARYVVDKVTGPEAEAQYEGRTPEYCRCSLKPGIGANWYALNKSDVFRANQDFVVMDGDKLAPPRYYDKLRRREDKSVAVDAWEFARAQRALAAHADNTDERLRVREVVHHARVANLKRDI